MKAEKTTHLAGLLQFLLTDLQHLDRQTNTDKEGEEKTTKRQGFGIYDTSSKLSDK